MNREPLHAIDPAAIAQYDADGAVCIRGQFDRDVVPTCVSNGRTAARSIRVLAAASRIAVEGTVRGPPALSPLRRIGQSRGPLNSKTIRSP